MSLRAQRGNLVAIQGKYAQRLAWLRDCHVVTFGRPLLFTMGRKRGRLGRNQKQFEINALEATLAL
jgi:hypothetical protein